MATLIGKDMMESSTCGKGRSPGSTLLLTHGVTLRRVREVTLIVLVAGCSGSVDSKPLPVVTVTASPSALVAGQSTVLSWSSTDADACGAEWTANTATSGSQARTPDVTTIYEIECTGDGGTGRASTTVTVTPRLATVTVSANRSTTWSISPGGLGGSGTSGSYTVTPSAGGSSYTLAPGVLSGYTVTVGTSDGNGATLFLMPGQSKAFTITYTSVAAPTVSLTATPAAVTLGQSSTLTWSSSGADACNAPWTTSMGSSGNQTVSPSATTTYTISCTGGGGTASASATVTVSTEATIQVTSNHATTWTISPGGLNGSGTSGTQVVNPSVSGTVYAITPAAQLGYTVSVSSSDGSGNSLTVFPGQTKTFTLSYATVSPTVTLTASPSTIAAGESSVLSWTSTNASSCSAGWTSGTATSGSQTVSPGATTTYSIICAGPGGNAGDNATVTVNPPPQPAIGLSRSSLSFSAVQNPGTLPGTLPQAETVSIDNVGQGSLTNLTASVVYQSASGWLSASLSGTAAPATLTVRPTTANLSPGTYSAEVRISAAGATNSPQVVTVSFTVTAP